MNKSILITILFSLTVASTNLSAQTANTQATNNSNDEKAILATVDKFFEALANSDAAGMESTTISGSIFMSSTRNVNGKIVNSARTVEELIAGLSSSGARNLERYWNPTVLIREGIAAFWAPYDFYINGDFSHCGIDSFQLFKTDGEWLIGSSSFNREQEGCPPSPLGPIN